ncbi:MAG: hypothetical protein U9Q81_03215 [Pseudomonadota bacterium]|nr:hypothetical protein [Pseudomonadota bacterium]
MIDGEAVEIDVTDTEKIRVGDAGTPSCGTYGKPIFVENVANFSGEQGFSSLHIGVGQAKIGKHVAAASDGFHLLCHRKASFNRLTRLRIRSISCRGV